MLELRSVSLLSPCAEGKHCSCCCLVAGYCCVGGMHVLVLFGNSSQLLFSPSKGPSPTVKPPGQKVSAGFCPIVYLMLSHMVLFPFPFILIKGPCFDIFNTASSVQSVAPSPLLSFLLVLSHCAYYYHTIFSHITPLRSSTHTGLASPGGLTA